MVQIEVNSSWYLAEVPNLHLATSSFEVVAEVISSPRASSSADQTPPAPSATSHNFWTAYGQWPQWFKL